MFLSVTHRILGPIVLLILIGAGTAAWISREAMETHDDLQSEEELAYELLTSVERTQKAFAALGSFADDVLGFDMVIPPDILHFRFQLLHDRLTEEIAHIRKMGTASDLMQSVGQFQASADQWKAEADIALGLTPGQDVPTRIRLGNLHQSAGDALGKIHETVQSGVVRRSEMKRHRYNTRVTAAFVSMLALFAVFGFFFMLFGRRLARSLRNLANAMERIREGEFDQNIEREFSQDEIGRIAEGVKAFGETLQALTEANARVNHMAMHDQLTGLANRRALEQSLAAAIARNKDRRSGLAILHVDLDRFKQVNDMYGHAAGDDILRHAAAALTSEIRDGDMVARIGGDEFVILLNDITSQDIAATIATRTIAAVSKPIEIWNDMVNVGASIGIALADDPAIDTERLLANADMALYIAKGAGRGRYSFYSEETRQQFETDMSTLRELRAGLEHGEIIAYFQPQIDTVNRKLIGFEALARWDHPRRGILGPGEFIGLAFDNGLGDRLSDIIVREAIGALLEWRTQGVPAPRVSVNFAAKQLRDNGLADYLDDALHMAGLQPGDITVEVLESVLFGDDADPAHATIAQLKRRGYRIELDDFGTGHASISNLRKFNVDGVKLDRVFVTGVDSDKEQEMILRTLIDLCRNLGISCLAEGVETDAERSKLLALGCSRIQGYAISPPMKREEVVDWVARFETPSQRPRAI